ncbi:MAG TPA: ABC transporter ATP-binding protein [Chitinispirillaceae bacterium]|nr:ABC transporter ATP-binding protein [Chitinispirillaceae bacterium]
MHAIELSNVSKWYRKDFWVPRSCAVADISFSVKQGCVTGFVGPNGAGKTTSIKMIMGLVFPDSGTITLYGKKTDEPLSRKGIAYLSEQPYFYNHLTVEESLRFAAELFNLPKNTIATEITRVLSCVELVDKNKSKVKSLSKGMQQRLNMAQALLGKPHTMILDEPMSGMDPPGRRLFRQLFRSLAKSGTTIFFSTHVLDDIEAVCDEVIVLSKGKVHYNGRVDALLEKGYQGKEMVISGGTRQLREQLVSAGCSLTEHENGLTTLFVRSGIDPQAVQTLIQGCSSVVYHSIADKRMSLEDLLYKNTSPQEQ